jgi:hypothetical protein
MRLLYLAVCVVRDALLIAWDAWHMWKVKKAYKWLIKNKYL